MPLVPQTHELTNKLIEFVFSGHDIHLVYEDLPPTVTMYNLTGIYHDVNTRFYTNIIAYNHAGLHTIASSDGCQIDKDNPIAGVVYDGSGKSFSHCK